MDENEPDTCTEVEDVPIESVKYHEHYDPSKKVHDIALIRLSHSVELSKSRINVKTICLPVTESQQIDHPDVGKMLTVAGWGHTENNTVATNDVLIQAQVPYLPYDSCVARFKEEKKNHPLIKSNIYETQICAGGVGRVDS